MKLILTIAISAALAGPAWAGHRQAEAGKLYDIVRADLIRDGYQPAHLKHSPSDVLCEGDDICVKYPEVLDCGGTGVRPCEFAFIRSSDRKYVIVFTHGEERLTVDKILDATEDDLKEIREHQ